MKRKGACKRKSSARWLRRQSKDCYVKQAAKAGWRSRAAFKLQDLDKRHQLLPSGGAAGGGVIDLGAAPGGWSQYAVSRVGAGKVLAIDILPMAPISGVYFMQGDCFEPDMPQKIRDFFKKSPISIVLSDMSPNITGNSSIDVPRSLELAEWAARFALETLSAKGSFLVKVFQGAGFAEYIDELRGGFASVKICKPASSRSESREIYVLARQPKHEP